MNSTEDRLRAAAQAAASTVAPGSAPPLRLAGATARPLAGAATTPRRPLRRVAAPLAAAAAVLTVIAVSLTVADATGGHRVQAHPGHATAHQHTASMASAPATAVPGVPPYYVTLSRSSTFPQQAAVHATATGTILATITAPRPYGTFTWVSGAANDRTFVLAAQQYWRIRRGRAGISDEVRDGSTPTVFFRLQLEPAANRTRLTALPRPVVPHSDQLGGIALSPDGKRLALALRGGDGQTGARSRPALQVVTLATGGRREWTSATADWIGNTKPMGEPLSWTADGREIEFQAWDSSTVAVRLLDITRPGRDLDASKLIAQFQDADGVPAIDAGNTMVTPDGSKVIIPTMRTIVPKAPPASKPLTTGMNLAITEFPVQPGKAAVTLDPWQFRGERAGSWQDILWSSRSGGTLIVMAPPGRGPGVQRSTRGVEPVTGVLTHRGFTPLAGIPLATLDVAF
jgi:hypothetical protein